MTANQFGTEAVGALATFHDSRRIPLKSSERIKGSYPYYGASGIVDWVDGYLFEGLHLLVSEDGENLRSRSTPIAFLANDKFWVNNHAHVLRGANDRDTKYLAYAIQASDVATLLTGSAQPKLSQGALSSLRVPAPDLVVREGIAEVLGALDDKIAANERVAQLAEDLLRSEFDALGIVRDGQGDVELTELVEFNPRLKSESTHPFVDMQALPTRGWTVPPPVEVEKKSGARFTNGDTLLARITPCLENRKAGFVDMLAEGQVGVGSTEFIVMRSRAGVPPPLSFFVATNDNFRSFAIQQMVGTSGRQRVAAVDLASYQVSLPDRKALEDWGEMAGSLFADIRNRATESRHLAALRDGLLPELMSGRMTVRQAESQVEEVL